MTLKLDEYLENYRTKEEKLRALNYVAAELTEDLLHAYEHANPAVTESIRQDSLQVESKICEIRGPRGKWP